MLKQEKKGLVLLLIIISIYFFYQVKSILFPFCLAIILAYLLNPLIDKLVKSGMPRMGALTFVFGLLFVLFMFVFITVIPAIINELEILTNKLPFYIAKLDRIINKLNNQYQQINISSTLDRVLERIMLRIKELSVEFIERTTQVMINLLSRMFSLIMAPILTFYILKDFKLIKNYFWSIIPDQEQSAIRKLLIRIDEGLVGFFKGQLIVSILVGVLSTLALYWMGVKFSLIIGVLASIFNVVPYFGPFIGAGVAGLIAFGTSLKLSLRVILVFFIIQQIEGNIISPKIMGEEVGLHPVIIIFSLLAGGELLGVIGMLIAIPVAIIAKELLNYLFVEVLATVDNS
ncbi:putative permease [Halobacteroides halobius DSM 5150]|uniref:Putative permease n=1 Tax=Halobacteroides halobius (strain ATCC 35273 / DSM 5150 / MD-1) TaxID=748449 RepID=L0KD07_HALHC|nr:AI-2E family transporter [Halobacteroides halobius]AGB41963.1 putative permease [Halobacteroides halobius DSM 5150]